MEKILAACLGFLALSLVMPILGVLFGAFSGWAVGLVFEETVLQTLTRFGVETTELTMWQLGAALGFVGGFLKTTVSSTK